MIEVASDTLLVNLNQPPKFRGRGRSFALVALVLLFVLKSEAQLMMPRDRPQLNFVPTTFAANNGKDLRGPFTSTEWADPVPAQSIASMRGLGFNSVYLYAATFDPNYQANGSTDPGYSAANVDATVSEAESNGLYLIITIGNGDYYAA